MPALGNNIRLGGALLVISFAVFAAILYGAAQIVDEKETAAAAEGAPVDGGGPPAAAGQPVTVDLLAKDLSFSPRTIRAAVSVEVTVRLDNQDSGVLHNVAFYETPQAQEEIFVGELITGVAQIEEVFTAPARPGTYFFRCDVHPDLMTGSFIVD
jgi:plastocyanin